MSLSWGFGKVWWGKKLDEKKRSPQATQSPMESVSPSPLPTGEIGFVSMVNLVEFETYTLSHNVYFTEPTTKNSPHLLGQVFSIK